MATGSTPSTQGVIDTPIWTSYRYRPDATRPIDPNEVAKAGVRFGRAGQAQDIANGVLFLASDESIYMTGAELGIDSDYTIRTRPRRSRLYLSEVLILIVLLSVTLPYS